MTTLAETFNTITSNPWFTLVDITFHAVVIWHVIAHVCRAGKRLHQKVHVPLRRARKWMWPDAPTSWASLLDDTGRIREVEPVYDTPADDGWIVYTGKDAVTNGALRQVEPVSNNAHPEVW